jgi:hypothetical protein
MEGCTFAGHKHHMGLFIRAIGIQRDREAR